jgi:hypothetical protein
MIDVILIITFNILVLASTFSFIILYMSNKSSESVYETLGR